MILTSDEHCFGRTVEDTRFQILSNQVSAQHCKIYRKKIASEDAEDPSKFCTYIFLKDTRLCFLRLCIVRDACNCCSFWCLWTICSTNGTYLNWEKLNKQSPEIKLHHGDIISFSAPPHHGSLMVYVLWFILCSYYWM